MKGETHPPACDVNVRVASWGNIEEGQVKLRDGVGICCGGGVCFGGGLGSGVGLG